MKAFNHFFLTLIFLTLTACGSDDSSNSAADTNADTNADTKKTEAVIWSGEKITFKKENGADFTKAENQDKITEKVILVRGAKNLLYNIASESEYKEKVSPAGTKWAIGSTEKLSSLTFTDFKSAIKAKAKELPGKSMVLHLTEENIYIDVKFISWTSGSDNGGGFSYERSSKGE